MAANDILQLRRDIEAFAKSMPDGITEALIGAGGRIADQLQRDIQTAGLVKTGALRDSVIYSVYDDVLSISMNDYGYYQNFGVQGHGSDAFAVNTVPSWVGVRPSSGTTYAFKETVTEQLKEANKLMPWMLKTRLLGIKPRNFIKVDEYEDIFGQSLVNYITDAAEAFFANTYITD